MQVYVRREEEMKQGEPTVFQELKGFEKIFLTPGETKKVEIKIKGDLKNARIAAGASSRNISIVL